MSQQQMTRDEKSRTIGDKVIECLENEGVEYICGVPGEENSEFLMALQRAMKSGRTKMKFILTRHEQGASFICDAMGRLTGKPQVALTTLGPGATNTITGVANAYMDKSPMVIISGQVDSSRLHRSSFQNIDTMTLFKPITHFTDAIRNSDCVPELVSKCFKLARQLGPTHFELSKDIAKYEIEKEKWSKLKPISVGSLTLSLPPFPNEKAVEGAFSFLQKAKKPLLLVGRNVVSNNAVQQLREFVNTTGIMTINTPMTKGCIDMINSPYSLFTAGFMVTDQLLLDALSKSDCVITVGYDQRELAPERWNTKENRNIIHIDTQTTEVDAYFVPKYEIIGDIGQTLSMLTDRFNKNKPNNNMTKFSVQEFVNSRQMLLKKMDEFNNDTQSGRIKPQKILYELRQALRPNDILVSDVGLHMLYITKYFRCYEPNTCLIAGGFASMGFGLPGAIGCKLTCPDKSVVAICGDGGLLMTVQEMETAVRMKTNIVVIVWVDNEYGMIAFEQNQEFHQTAFTRFGNPNFVELAKAFKWKALFCDQSKEFGNVLRQALQMDGPVLIEVPIDYGTQNSALSES